jgi:hypothetical protein
MSGIFGCEFPGEPQITLSLNLGVSQNCHRQDSEMHF